MTPSFLKLRALLFTLFLLPAIPAWAEDAAQAGATLSQSQLEKLVAPIAIYPDPLLAQILPASTYPLEIVEAARLIRDKGDFDKIDEQKWDPSVKAVAHYPNVLKMMNDDLAWTQELGQAVLTQQDDVMQSVQTLRQQAEAAGNLKTTKQQVVKKVIVKEYVRPQIEILPADPEIIYVPVYNPQVVYVAPIYPVSYSVISFGYGWRVGSWLNIGFYWPARTIFYCGPHYWHGYWGAGWSPAYVNRTVIHNTYVTNVYNNNSSSLSTRNVVTRDGVIRSAWAHNTVHGNPYNGRTVTTKTQPRFFSKGTQNSTTTSNNTVRTQTVRAQGTSTKTMTTTQAQHENLKMFQQNLNHTRSTANTKTSSTTVTPRTSTFRSTQQNSHNTNTTTQTTNRAPLFFKQASSSTTATDTSRLHSSTTRSEPKTFTPSVFHTGSAPRMTTSSTSSTPSHVSSSSTSSRSTGIRTFSTGHSLH